MVTFDDSYSNSRIADLHAAEEERFVEASAPQMGFEYVNLRGYTINPAAVAAIKEEAARDAMAVGFELSQQILSVAVKDPNNPKTQALLEQLQKLRYVPKVYMCSTSSLEHGWARYADVTASVTKKKGVFEIDPEDIQGLIDKIKTKGDVLEILLGIRSSNSARRISETLELIFAGAAALGASDIHIEPEDGVIRLRYRFDGVLHDIADLDGYIYRRLMSRLKLLSGMMLNSKEEAQDGRFTFEMGKDREIEIRSSVIPGALGESIVMRLLDPTASSFRMDNLKLNQYVKAIIETNIKKPNGLIITTGPTGSGKTTALYAFLQETHTEGVKIITIENPVEYKLEGIVQTQTGDDYTFASGLRAILRQDPDIIMVGEIRDHEVAETAIHASQTGHLVFSTLHTNSAVAAFARLIDLGVDPRIFGSSVNLILGQRLIRTLCNDCKKPYTATAPELATIKALLATHPHPQPITEPLTLYKATGCDVCGNSGYKGRIGILEGIAMDEAVEEAILRDPREHIILEAARPQGVPTMAEDGIDKVLSGLSSLEELERVVELPHPVADTATTAAPAEKPASEASDDDFLAHVV